MAKKVVFRASCAKKLFQQKEKGRNINCGFMKSPQNTFLIVQIALLSLLRNTQFRNTFQLFRREKNKNHPSAVSVNTDHDVAMNISQSSPNPSFDPMYPQTPISTVHEEKKKNHYSSALLYRCLIHDASNPFDSSYCLFQEI